MSSNKAQNLISLDLFVYCFHQHRRVQLIAIKWLIFIAAKLFNYTSHAMKSPVKLKQAFKMNRVQNNNNSKPILLKIYKIVLRTTKMALKLNKHSIESI